MSTTRHDVIIVGGGHNGLTCGAFLARAGKRVLILEADSVVGGFSTTRELMPEAPGFRSTPHAIDLFAGMIPRSIATDLQLHRYGFRTFEADPYCTFLGPDGASIAQWTDLDRTVAEIARYSRRDAERYRRFATILGEAWNAFLPYLQGHPKQVEARTVAETIWRLVKSRKSLGPAARILLSSPTAVLEEWFERDEVKVIFGTWAAATGQVTLDTPGYSAGMAMAVLSHRWGCYRAVGGMGALVDALQACFTTYGGAIRTSAPVHRILVEGGRAVGVALAHGEEIRAELVVGAVDPATLFTRLLEPEHLPDETRDELRAMEIAEKNITYFTGHAALSARPTLPRHGREEDLLGAGYMMLVRDYESLQRALIAAERGKILEDNIPTWLSLSSIKDRSLVPEGSAGESLYFMLPVTPYELEGGKRWSEEKDVHLDRVLNLVDSYAEGTKRSVIASHAVSPVDMSRWVTKGHASHIDMSMAQMGPWRPTPSLAGYRTPVESLWHVSAGAHPIPSVNGWPGRTAARTILACEAGRLPLTRRIRIGTGKQK